ncbi:MAG: hypothetical protein ACRDTT_00575 [Pseudonocardiaceae bacterium]
MTYQEAIMGAAALVFTGLVVVVVIIQVAASWRARMSVAREEAYRRLAEEATQTQEKTTQQLELMVAELRSMRERTTELERVLREVEEPWKR